MDEIRLVEEVEYDAGAITVFRFEIVAPSAWWAMPSEAVLVVDDPNDTAFRLVNGGCRGRKNGHTAQRFDGSLVQSRLGMLRQQIAEDAASAKPPSERWTEGTIVYLCVGSELAYVMSNERLELDALGIAWPVLQSSFQRL